MTFDQVIDLVGLAFTAIGLLFVIFGWIIPYRQNIKIEEGRKKAEIAFRQKQWEKEQIDRQISEFYGPISALLQEQDIVFERILYMIGRRYIFGKNQTSLSDLPENEQKIWTHYVDTYKIPLNNKIVEIIRCKKHLVFKSEIPTCFKAYLDYTLGWELLDNQKRNAVPNYYEYYYSFNYPVEFTHYINETLKALLKKQSDLIGETQKDSTAY